MEDKKRLFSSAFHASGDSSGGFGRQAAAQRSHWNQQVNPSASRDQQVTAGDPLQDLQRLLNRLLTDVEAGAEPLTRRNQQQKSFQQPGRQENSSSWDKQDALLAELEPRDNIPMRRSDVMTSRTSKHRSRRSAAELDGFGADTNPRQQVERRGNYDHWFTGRKTPVDRTLNQRHSRYRSDLTADFGADSKTIGRVPPSPSWPLNCPIHSPAVFKQQQHVTREIAVTDLRSQRDIQQGRTGNSVAAWWQALQSSGASAGPGSDISAGGGRIRAVSNRREATLRASAEQLDHLSRRDGASGSSTAVAAAAVAAASHRRSASDAAVRGYRASDDSLDYEETPLVGRGGDDSGQWANEAEAGMSQWYKPRISREHAIAALRDAPSGSFLVRDSQTYPGAYGLALRVSRPPAQQLPPPPTRKTTQLQDPRDSLVRHFLIEVSPGGGGVRIRGCSNEPVFRSLAELVQCHSLTPLALPCCLRLLKPAKTSTVTTAQCLPKSSLCVDREHRTEESATARRGTTYKVLYFCTADVPLAAVSNQQQWPHQAVSSAVGQVASPAGPRPIECRMRVSGRGVKLSGQGWHTEFRLAYAAEDCVACELDPAGRRYSDATGAHRESSLFGLIVKKYGFYGDQNACLVLGGNLDAPAKMVVDFVNRTCLQASAAPVSGGWTRNAGREDATTNFGY